LVAPKNIQIKLVGERELVDVLGLLIAERAPRPSIQPSNCSSLA
jgi:hypothetical protein